MRTSAGPILGQMRAGWARHPLAAIYSGLLAVGAIAAFVWGDAGAILAPILVPISSVVAGVIGLRETRRIPERHQRLPWILISSGFLAASLGVVAFAATSMFIEVGAFGPMDLPIVVGYGLLIAGLLSQPQIKESRAHQIRVLVDGVIGGVSVAAVMWTWFIADALDSLSHAPLWDRIFGVAYPVLDLVAIVVIMITFLRKSPQRYDLRLFLVAGGLLSQVVADLSWFFEGAGKTFDAASPNFAPFILAFALFCTAAIMMGDVPRPREYAEQARTPWWPMLAPYGWSAVMVGVLFVRARSGALTADVQLLLSSTLAVGGLVVFRQFVAINENRQLVERERKALISTISHELRTPLTAMVGFLDVLSTDAEIDLPPDERDELIQVVDQQARYLARIVSDLVLLARGSPGEMQLDRTLVDVGQVIRRAVTAMDTGTNDVQVVVPAGLKGHLDGERLQQALVNLLSNAIRYGGDRRMVVATVDGEDLTIAVHDNGPGVPKRYELSIWERFERGEHRLDSTVPGSGIGLAIVAAIAQAHGGRSSYSRSHLLGGACFGMTFPGAIRVDEPTRAREPHRGATEHPSPEPHPVGQMLD